MITTTLSAFRKALKAYLDQVTEGSETLIIHRKKQSDVVVLSMDAYNALMNTTHEMSSRINQQRLEASIASLRSGQE
jgi:antitoxin YefM